MTAHLLILLILIPLIGSLFVFIAKNDKYYALENVYNVFNVTLLVNVITILYIFSYLDSTKEELQLIEIYHWISFPTMEIVLGCDVFSMLLLLSINFSFLIAGFCLPYKYEYAKELLATALIFIGVLNGYLLAVGIISFYIFFVALSAPLIVLMSIHNNLRKKNALIRFSIYNLVGALFLFVSVVLIYNYKKEDVLLIEIANLNIRGKIGHFIVLSIFFAFISRLPIWPFHYWITTLSSGLKNPLVFIIGNLIPIIGLYGFMRFWPNDVPATISIYSKPLQIICITTMLFIALISITHKDFRYKLFSYTTIYDLLFLLGVFLPTDKITLNIGYSLFSFIIIISVLSFLITHIEQQKQNLNLYGLNGILCYMPRTSICVSLFILAGIGLPITPLFWNNFMIITEIFHNNLVLGVLVIFSLSTIAISLLESLYKLKDKNFVTTSYTKGADLSDKHYIICLLSIIILFFSFFKPLWFMF